jgi:3-hydroxyacyl-CoA dehydrogenase/enoyl-CoA hydratase/3-hydroxybutyryl-CoA epimerase
MGGGIAQLTSSRGIWSRLKDINYDALAKGLQAASKIYAQDVKRRKYSKAVAEEKMAHISQGLDYSGFQQADIVIEAVVENMDVKKKVFRELSDVTRENTILASNTSALSVTEMASVVKNPGRVIGFHFFNPVSKMPLVELITSPQTSSETLVTALELVKHLGKTPIVVKDSTGFIVNRILLAYISEAGRILEETGALEDIDEVMTQFGMPMGPFTLSDEVGLDVGSKVMHILEARFGKRFTPSPIFENLLAKGYLGKKSGKGFYVHKDKNLSTNTEVMDLLGEKSLKSLDKELALKRMMGIMINEAAMCLQEEIVDGADSIDVGMIFGTGFPPFRGGLLKYADSLGIDKIVEDLEGLSLDLRTSRFEPCAYLINLKNNKQKFYS